MTYELVVQLARQAVLTAFWLSAPLLAVALAVGGAIALTLSGRGRAGLDAAWALLATAWVLGVVAAGLGVAALAYFLAREPVRGPDEQAPPVREVLATLLALPSLRQLMLASSIQTMTLAAMTLSTMLMESQDRRLPERPRVGMDRSSSPPTMPTVFR